jgi:hypothetical protein
MSSKNTKIVNIQSFYGGQSSDEAIGTNSSFSYSRALDHRTNPSQLSILPGPRKISAGVVTDLILNMVQVQNGTRYAIGDQGYLYKIDTSNVVTFAEKLPSATDGMLYRQDSDAVYIATPTDLRRYYPISGTPDIDYTYGASRSADTHAYRTGGSSTYSVPVALTEAHYCSFQPDIEPFYSIKVNITAKGTGNWTLTLHDGLNNTLATSTVTNADITSGLTEFVFSSQVRALVKPNARTYHFHLTSTVNDGTVACSSSGNLNTADFELWAYRFVQQTNGFHPMAEFQQFICIGNERYLAVWEPLTPESPPNTEFQRHRLTFPPGYEVCGLAATDEFLLIACEKRSTDGSKDFQDGKIFLWDGTAQTYNQIINITGGSPYAIQTYENYPYFVVNGWLCAWPGGKNIIKVRKIANTGTVYKDYVDNTKVYPNMMAIRENLLHIGYPSTTNNTSIEHGVYVWGSLEKNYPASFNYGYVTSTGVTLNTSGNYQIGAVRSFGDEMYISWKEGNSYGLDIVDNYCDPAPVAKFRSRRFDAGAVYKQKQALRMAIDSAALPSGVTITPTYKLDDSAEQTLTNFNMTVGDKRKIATISQGLFKRIVYGFDIASTATETPTIYANSLEWNPLLDQDDLR